MRYIIERFANRFVILAVFSEAVVVEVFSTESLDEALQQLAELRAEAAGKEC